MFFASKNGRAGAQTEIFDEKFRVAGDLLPSAILKTDTTRVADES